MEVSTVATVVSYPYNLLLGAVLVGGAGFYFLRRYISGGVCRSKAQLDGKTVIITGANSGIGKATAIDLAKRNARVILACRSVERGEQAAVEVRKMSGNDNVVFVQLDLASLASVRQFAEQILQQEPQIDILINNAAIIAPEYTETEDGYETSFAVNHLGHFLLTNLLLERLKEAPAARVVIVSSKMYSTARAKVDFDDLGAKKAYGKEMILFIYGRSKVLNMLFLRELAQRIKGSRITVNALHPGAVATGLGRNGLALFPFLVRCLLQPLIQCLLTLFLKTPMQGAQTTIHCAVAEELEGVSGKYFEGCKEVSIVPGQATDDQLAERLWRISCEMVGLTSD